MTGPASPQIDEKKFQVFQEACRKAGITPDKTLYPPLATVMESALIIQVLVSELAQGGARGITPEGQVDLIDRVVRTVGEEMREYARRNRLGLQRVATVAVAAGFAVTAVVCLALGHWWGWSAGRGSVQAVMGKVEAAALLSGPDGAEQWLAWMSNNNALVLRRDGCAGPNRRVVSGREVCDLSLWNGPAPAVPGRR